MVTYLYIYVYWYIYWVWARTYPRRTVRALSVGIDRVWFGSQAFAGASAFNADIGAWNTAAVNSLSYVCAAFGPAARHRGGRAQSGCGAVRCGAALVRDGAADARARMCVRTHTYSLPRLPSVSTQAARREDDIRSYA